ncbi:MAG: hypothetical protein Kilf2KO_24450 [Rhodospirillales bacterium]
MSLVNDSQRAAFAALADLLIPEAEGMPSASQVDLQNAPLDRVVELRPDLRPPFYRAVNAVKAGDPRAVLTDLAENDPEAFGALGVLASAAYYMQPEVRRLIGYPGQENRPVEENYEPEYVTNGMLQEVIDRGPIYRPTPLEA